MVWIRLDVQPFVEPGLGNAGDAHIEFVTLACVEREGFDRADAVHRLDQLSPALYFGMYRGADLAPNGRQHRHQNEANQQAERQHDRGHDWAHRQHHRDKNHQHKGIQQCAEQLPG